MKKVLSFLLVFFIFLSAQSQVVLNMKKVGGVYEVPCKVNGLNLSFIFDTGASDVSISLIEAMFMLRHGYLKEENILGKVRYSIANGDIAEGTKILLNSIVIGGIEINDVEASVIHEMKAPLLLGQSAIQKLGKIEINENKLTILTAESKQDDSKILLEDGTVTGYDSKFQMLNLENMENYDHFTDTRDDKIYLTVKIGNQIWMAENLAYEKTGVSFPEGGYRETMSPRRFIYLNENEYKNKYGLLYSYYNAINACPLGWHLPSKDEWITLLNYIGGKVDSEFYKFYSENGAKIKSNFGWHENKRGYSGNGTNETGFNGLPSGSYFENGHYNYFEFGEAATWWCSDRERGRYKGKGQYRAKLDVEDKFYITQAYLWPEFSVRCICNNIKAGFTDYSEDIKLKKGMIVLFNVAEKYYKAVVNNKGYDRTNVKDVQVYNSKTNNWTSIERDNITVPNTTIIGYKL
jgi:clan AA aspartic protease (TIGR02281 family)